MIAHDTERPVAPPSSEAMIAAGYVPPNPFPNGLGESDSSLREASAAHAQADEDDDPEVVE